MTFVYFVPFHFCKDRTSVDHFACMPGLPAYYVSVHAPPITSSASQDATQAPINKNSKIDFTFSPPPGPKARFGLTYSVCFKCWQGQDSNLHLRVFTTRHLIRACLPVPPPCHIKDRTASPLLQPSTACGSCHNASFRPCSMPGFSTIKASGGTCLTVIGISPASFHRAGRGLGYPNGFYPNGLDRGRDCLVSRNAHRAYF